MLSIIIPILNEEKILEKNKNHFKMLNGAAEIIFVDGGSTDRSVDIAQNYGRVIKSGPGRAGQKNAGVEHAGGSVVFFLHADTIVCLEALQKIPALIGEGFLGGCLSLKIDARGFVFRVFERVINFRARLLGIMDGDLGLFVRKDIFRQCGGFDPVPYMEDIFFSRKIRRLGRLAVIDKPIVVSSRRWQEEGFWRTLWRYTLAYLRLWSGRISNGNEGREDEGREDEGREDEGRQK